MHLKVISLNLWWGGRLFPQALGFLKEQDADIVLLQEVNNATGPGLLPEQRTMEVLKQLDYPYSSFEEAVIYKQENTMTPHGLAVLSKSKIKSSSKRFIMPNERAYYDDLEADWVAIPRIIQHVVIEVEKVEINVFNVHGVWDMEGEQPTPDRKKMSSIMLEETKGLKNVILGGDTNAKASNPTMLAIEEQLVSVFGQELTTTFNMRRKSKGGYAQAAVDLMFISPDIKLISKDCPDVDISDHLPIIAELEIT